MRDTPFDFDTTPIWLSLKISSSVVVFSLPFALVLSWILSRKQFYGKTLLESLITLPLLLPPVVTGYFLLVLLSPNNFLGKLLASVGISFNFNWLGAALAAACVSFPLMVRPIKLSLDHFNREYELAGETFGLTPWQVKRLIIFPLISPGILAGSFLSFARSLGEFGATITFVGNIPEQTQTLPLAIHTALQSFSGQSEAAAYVSVSVALCLASIFLGSWFERKVIHEIR